MVDIRLQTTVKDVNYIKTLGIKNIEDYKYGIKLSAKKLSVAVSWQQINGNFGALFTGNALYAILFVNSGIDSRIFLNSSLPKRKSSKFFKKETKMSMLEYLIDVRFRQAENLLGNSTLSIKEISNMCGFSDPLYFSALFKKYHKISPKDYRKKYQ